MRKLIWIVLIVSIIAPVVVAQAGTGNVSSNGCTLEVSKVLSQPLQGYGYQSRGYVCTVSFVTSNGQTHTWDGNYGSWQTFSDGSMLFVTHNTYTKRDYVSMTTYSMVNKVVSFTIYSVPKVEGTKTR